MDFDFSSFDTTTDNIEMKHTKAYDRLWRTGDGGSICLDPLLIDNILFFGSNDKYIYALDVENREVKWSYKTDGMVFCSSPVYEEGTIYIGSYDYHLYKMDANDGSLIWRFKTGGEIASTPVIVNDIVCIGSGMDMHME